MLLRYVFLVCLAACVASREFQISKKEYRAQEKELEQLRRELIKSTILTNYDELQYKWNMFKTKYNKKYDSPEEDLKRLNIYTENMKQILEHNDRYNKGVFTYKIGINEYSDLTDEEFRILHGHRPMKRPVDLSAQKPLRRKLGASREFKMSKKEVRARNKVLEQLRRKLVKNTILKNFDALLYEWNMFKTKYNKKYASPEEDLKRLNIYTENMKRILEHNDRYDKGVVTYSVGMNKYGDWTEEERNTLLGHRPMNKEENKKFRVYTPPLGSVTTNEVDWRKSGAVTAIKEQGECRSGWAFSAAGAIEGQFFRQTKRLVDLSAQNLIDCSRGYGNTGCGGGSVEAAFKYVEENGGIDTELGYPYEGYNAPECRYELNYVSTTIDGYQSIPENEEILANAVRLEGPISAAVDAAGFGFHFYKKGIYYNETCSWEYENLNHAVLIVGFGNVSSVDYWHVKNSWGEGWGEGGYMRLARNRENNCGIATNTVVPRIQTRPESDDDLPRIENRPAFDGL